MPPRNKKLILISFAILVVGIIFILTIRGDEDTWVKDASGKWMKHGNPAIYNFDTCAEKYPVQESYPERCAMPDGPTFTKGVNLQ